jgi:beta-phosphoglucomutase-like phosphatase (HAD superfamily)
MPLPAARIDTSVAGERGLPGRPGPVTSLAGAAEPGAGPGPAVVYEDALSGVCVGRIGNGPGDALRSHGADLVVTDLAQLLDDEGKAGTDDDPQR